MIGKRLSKDQLIELAEKMAKDGKEVLVEEYKADMRGDGYYQLLLFQIVDGEKIFVKACSSYQKEVFKMTKNYTHSQKSIYEKLETQIKKAIVELENKIAAFGCIEYCPKKDGSQKDNFSLNFGLKDVGVSYKDRRWGKIENVHPVDISLYYGISPYEKNGVLVPSAVNIAVKPRYNQEKNEYLDGFNYCTDTIYFSSSDVTDFLGFDAKENPEKITAENILKLIKVFWIGRLTERLNLHKKELERLPEFFDKAVEISNYLVTEIGKTAEFSYIHNFFYDNFENKDVYYLCNLDNK